MKKLLSILIVLLLVGISQSAFALPYLPTVPNDQPLYFKFNNYEQINPTAAPGAEQNWGILDVTSIAVGNTTNLPSGPYPVDHQLFARGNAVWSDILPGEVTGIFYDIQRDTTNVGDPLASTGGYLDLYWDPNNDFDLNYNPASRTAQDQYTGATDGEFLARIQFLNGAISAGNANTSIVGSVVPSPGGFTTGVADSFGAIVADVDGDGTDYGAGDGAWAKHLDTNWFDTLLGDNTADFRFKNSYNPYRDWDDLANNQIGAISDDPARAFSQPIPEPTTMILFGLGLLGVAGVSRKKRSI